MGYIRNSRESRVTSWTNICSTSSAKAIKLVVSVQVSGALLGGRWRHHQPPAGMMTNITLSLRFHYVRPPPLTTINRETPESSSSTCSQRESVLTGACDCEWDPAGADLTEAPPAAQPV